MKNIVSFKGQEYLVSTIKYYKNENYKYILNVYKVKNGKIESYFDYYCKFSKTSKEAFELHYKVINNLGEYLVTKFDI